MDRLNQLRGETGDSHDSTLDTSSPPSEAFMSANETSSKYFSLSDVDSTFSISPSKDNAASVTSEDSERTITNDTEIITNLSPIPKKSDADNYKIGEHIEAANILSGGVNIFDDNENSYDGDELVIDDNVLEEEKTNVDMKLCEDVVLPLEKAEDSLTEVMDEAEGIPSKDTEVVLQIDGKNVDAIDIGNGLYLYRKVGQDELAAVQIVDDDTQQPSFKFLKVRENTEGNLEVYEEIEVEIPKEVSTEDEKTSEKNPHVPIKNISKVINEPCNKVIDKINTIPKIESNTSCTLASEPSYDLQSESKPEFNLNGKMMKFNESRKSPIVGTFTPMTYHSTPNKDGIPLTKTMVDLHLHPSRHSDNIKKTIEVHTDSSKPKSVEIPVKTIEPNTTSKLEELDSSIQSTSVSQKENISKSTATEHKIDTEAIIKHSSKEFKCDASDQIQKNCEQNLDNAIKPVDKKEYTVQNSDVNRLNEEQKIQCLNETGGPCLSEEKQNDNDIYSKVTHDATLPSTDNKKSIQCDENIQDRETSRKESHDMKTSNKNVTECNENKTEKHLNGNHNKNLLEGNILTNEKLENTTVENKSVVLPTQQVGDDQLIDKLSLPTYKKNDVMQPEDPIINQDTCKNPLKSLPSNVVNTFSENAIQNTIEQEKKKDDLIIKQSSTSKSISEADTNKEKSITALDDSKTVVADSEDVSKTNIDTKFEANNSGVISTNNENVNLKLRDLQVADDDFSKKESTDNYIEEQSNTKDPDTGKENPISLVISQKHVPELTATNNSDISPSKIDNKSTIVTQFLPNNKQLETRKEVPIAKFTAARPISYNSAVPFGKWTEANRQEFLNKIKETKVHSNNSNTNQIKQTNDLNRRDILKKFDSQRNSTTAVPIKISELSSVPKFSNKMDTTTFVSKSATTQQSIPPNSKSSSSKSQIPQIKHKPLITKKPVKPETFNRELSVQRRVINSQELIDKTIEGIITRTIKMKSIPDYMKEKNTIHTVENPKNTLPLPGSLDDIEMKMNELHGISFIERPIKELPQIYNHDPKTNNSSGNLNINKSSKVPNLLPFKSKESPKEILETKQDDISDEEIIEHEPITGDIDNSKQNLITLLSSKEKPLAKSKKETIITEKDFDQFARRNSKSYENCLTVNFDSKEQHNVVQTVVEKETSAKKLSRNELMLAESKAKSSSKQSTAVRYNNQQSKIPALKTSEDDPYNKNYQSKVQIAYQSALTDKRHREYPFTIIEDKPVKVVFMDTNTEFVPTQLNIQGQNLSPSKSKKTEPDSFVHSASESMDSDILDGSLETKSQDETKSKGKHQRKQVLTPVEEEPEIQLIEPSDLKVSPTKKRRIEDKPDKNSKNLVPKKSYLLNRSNAVEEQAPKADLPKNICKETDNRNDVFMGRSNAISAIDNLVKAAELIETQSENNTSCIMPSQPSEITHNTPVKRGRGRPRKYPLPESGSVTNKTLSPQKKPRLIDAKITKTYVDSDESSDGEIVKENWTMGKINENIVCPICDKLFRSENVVFKHVKHCTGPSPNRSDSDKRSPRRLRNSQESDRKLRDSASDDSDSEDEKLCNTKSNSSVSKSIDDSDDVIVIEDISAKENVDEKVNYLESKKVLRKTKHQQNIKNHICEFCGKTFRQLSYLVSHKLQHKTQDTKLTEKEYIPNKSVFSCEICKKEFRKLHHLVQHRIIHNPISVASRMIRKTSSEQQENKISKNQNDEASAGFRCEPCDKSFRKLHHLVEHRETHDGINKKCSTSNTQGVLDTSKSPIVHNCDICKKVFKKLEDFVDHKELHYETGSEKSDDKSVKSSLSTKDIIHECSLCYMVFPNEHSLNKHTVICLRKKKQSAAKQAAKKAAEQETESTENPNIAENTPQDIDVNIDPLIEDSGVTLQPTEISENVLQDDQPEEKLECIKDKIVKDQLEERKQNIEPKPSNLDIMPKKRHSNVSDKIKTTNDIVEIPAKIKKMEEKHAVVPDPPTTKKKISKEKMALNVTKRHASANATVPLIDDSEHSQESSDDNEVRYMLNPIFNDEQCMERKQFMKIRGLKRNSLQLERPKSKDLLKRRISLLHPPKIPRLKAKPIEIKPRRTISVENNLNLSKTEPAASTDSDDSDVKYSFPEEVKTETNSIPIDQKVKRQSLPKKRKSITTVAKRKSLGKMTTNKPRKRTTEVEHRCDCGQLFSSAALLSRHTTLAHTPPRIRKRRSPPPDTQPNTKPPNTKPPNAKPTNAKPATKPPTTKPANKPAQKPANLPKTNSQSKKSKSVTNSNKTKVGVATRKSSVNNETKASNDVKCEFNSKSLRSSKRGIPESSRTLADKPK